ncbi:cell division cycle protein 48 [Emiliania huxleyi CCMP1516]|uniref:Cell division cycle protein 48 n=2 Tax=Emiliania huxleyi TaxID=2903 RepID=A0A0D3JI25_EMIH1|nr:cell division cycle protein 48 [Emiliania huxleyi CCMP1516]EOD23160.1 cell division cycle protein 48 [Emiliania huxleyi CCMP1516]|eukprot:XP_005775589.1 cell division cycle protein 48 [Emiliania huxleyi CCMP1516]
MKLSLALPPLLLLLRDAHGAHPRLAVASAPRSEQLRLIPRPERLTELLRVPERLRGGGEEAEEAKPAHEVQSRKRLTVAETEAADPSSLMLSADALESLGLAGGEPVLLRGGKQRKTVCVAVGSEKGLSEDDVKLSAAARANLRLSAGDAVVATPMRDLPEAERVELCLISESAAGFEGGFEERFGGLTSYFKDMGRPVTEGDVIETEVDGHTLRWKVMGVEVPEGDAALSASGIVGAETEIFAENEISEEEAGEDSAIGYADIGARSSREMGRDGERWGEMALPRLGLVAASHAEVEGLLFLRRDPRAARRRGLDKELAQLRELIDLPLKQPEVFDHLGVRPARGVIIHGPAGSGKTMIAQAVRQEAGVWFRTVNGPEIMAKRPGEAESALREVFEQAEANAPAIIFIDELDALAPKRDKARRGPRELEKRIVSQLLTLLDGMKANKRVIVLAATSRPGTIDPALRRFGRFDRELAVETLQYPLKFAAKYHRYGLSASKGILLYGPSGCGKTLVAKAIANEVKSNFISVKGPELLSMWFGESEQNARGAAPCILFFDEIDSIAKPRGSGGAGGGEAGDRIVNQILTEIDGVGAKKSVFIIAATNRPDMLDSACAKIGRAHFEEAMLTARKSVTAADVKKFERFRQSIKAGK